MVSGTNFFNLFLSSLIYLLLNDENTLFFIYLMYSSTHPCRQTRHFVENSLFFNFIIIICTYAFLNTFFYFSFGSFTKAVLSLPTFVNIFKQFAIVITKDTAIWRCQCKGNNSSCTYKSYTNILRVFSMKKRCYQRYD